MRPQIFLTGGGQPLAGQNVVVSQLFLIFVLLN